MTKPDALIRRLTPFVYAFPNPQRLKAIQTETENLLVNLFTMRRAFTHETRTATQTIIERLIDCFLTVNGFDDRRSFIRRNLNGGTRP